MTTWSNLCLSICLSVSQQKRHFHLYLSSLSRHFIQLLFVKLINYIASILPPAFFIQVDVYSHFFTPLYWSKEWYSKCTHRLHIMNTPVRTERNGSFNIKFTEKWTDSCGLILCLSTQCLWKLRYGYDGCDRSILWNGMLNRGGISFKLRYAALRRLSFLEHKIITRINYLFRALLPSWK